MKKPHVKRVLALLAGAALLGAAGCAMTATVIDRSDTKTSITHPRLEGDKDLKVLLGGAVREIPLEDIRMIKIEPGESINFERLIYYAAQVILKDGSVLSESGTDSTYNRQCYVCVQNALVGKHRNSGYRIPLENVSQIKIER
jgi:hypothetical protein